MKMSLRTRKILLGASLGILALAGIGSALDPVQTPPSEPTPVTQTQDVETNTPVPTTTPTPVSAPETSKSPGATYHHVRACVGHHIRICS